MKVFSLQFLFQEFHIESEKITVKILNTLSLYENVNDLPKDSLVPIVLNQGLRTKISSLNNETEEDALIRDSLIEENRRMAEKLQNSLEKESILSENVTKSNDEISIVRNELETLKRDKDKRNERWTRIRFCTTYFAFPIFFYFVYIIWIYTMKNNQILFNVYDQKYALFLLFLFYILFLCLVKGKGSNI